MCRKFLCAVVLFFVGVVLCPARPVSADQTSDDFKAQIQVLQAQIQHLQQQAVDQNPPQPDSAAAPGATPAPENKVVGGDFPGSFKLPGTNTSIALHGFVDLQAFYDPNQYLGGKFQIGLAVPNGPAQQQTQGKFSAHDKLTRFSVETRTPTKFGELKTVLIQDYYGRFDGQIGGAGNCANGLICDGLTGGGTVQNFNYGPRQLYAYGILGRFLAGHYLSNFIDEEDQMEVLDSSGPAGVPAQQNPQLRYTMPVGKAFLSFAVEDPATEFASNLTPGVATNPYGAGAENVSIYAPRPDFSGKYNLDAPWGHLEASGTYRLLAFDDGLGHRSTTNAGGAMFGGTYAFHDGLSSAGALTWFGNGIQKYTPDDFVAVSSAQINNFGTPQQYIVAANEHGLGLFLAHTFSPVVRSNLGYGYNQNYWNAFIPADFSQPDATHTLHANVIWSPVPQTDFGFEIMRGTKTFRSELNLKPVEVTRLMTEFKYRF